MPVPATVRQPVPVVESLDDIVIVPLRLRQLRLCYASMGRMLS
jgi:hypothetical protein